MVDDTELPPAIVHPAQAHEQVEEHLPVVTEEEADVLQSPGGDLHPGIGDAVNSGVENGVAEAGLE